MDDTSTSTDLEEIGNEYSLGREFSRSNGLFFSDAAALTERASAWKSDSLK